MAMPSAASLQPCRTHCQCARRMGSRSPVSTRRLEVFSLDVLLTQRATVVRVTTISPMRPT